LKKIRFPVLMLAVLFAAVLFFSPRTQAATYNGETVYYTVLNDTLMPLTYPTMPVYRNGTIYVPYTLLSANFDIRAIYSSADQVLFLAGNDQILKFDVRHGITYDSSQKEIDQPAYIVKGQVFVPAQFTAKYLGLGYIFLADSNIVRVGDHRASYPDAFLASYLKDEMAAALDNLMETGGTTAPATTTTTTVQVPHYASFAFLSPTPDETPALLSTLDRAGVQAAIFLDRERIAADPLSVVSMNVAGQILGVYANPDALPEPEESTAAKDEKAPDAPDISVESPVNTEELIQSINGVNERLYALLREKSRLLLLDGDDYPELRGLGQASGFVSCSPTHRFTGAESSEALVNAVFVALEECEEDVLLLLDGSAVTSEALPELIATLRSLGFQIRSMDSVASALAE